MHMQNGRSLAHRYRKGRESTSLCPTNHQLLSVGKKPRTQEDSREHERVAPGDSISELKRATV
jgi:hypothetical protein